jgi:hypothetical protein
LVLVMPRERASEYDSFAKRFAIIKDCEVIVDRRVVERRHGRGGRPFDEQRQIDRRSRGWARRDILVLIP